ncbi:MAG: GDP-perosamine synthase [Dehalococcoidia bacterium]|nr:GDP-perosamine synthase [Bacillota bacterium]MBT9140759.1 GDP-perosamine synthase [Bacillota bacterium]MBT9142754.1 GDP-perosamine synthase [Bacillota bacterium]
MSISRNIPFCIPHFPEEDIPGILDRLREPLCSGLLTQGSNVREFEERFANYVGTKYGVALNSCTAALHIALECIGVGKGDEVIVPSNTFVATANAALYCGASPVFAEIDPQTFNINPQDIRNKITPKTKAIIPVHIAGQPCDMEPIMEIAREYNLYVIEDAAHAHGSVYKGQKCGSFGIANCFSFYPTKVMAGAEGGIITTDDEEIAGKARRLRNVGRGGMGPLEITEIGYNYRMNELQAVLCLHQFDNLAKLLEKRNKIAEWYTARLKDIDGIRPPYIGDNVSCSYYAYIIKVNSVNRDELRDKLGQQGIGTSIMFHPVHLQPIYRKLFGYKEGMLPLTEEVSRKVLSLPIYPKMSEDDVDYVVSTLKKEMHNAARHQTGRGK